MNVPDGAARQYCTAQQRVSPPLLDLMPQVSDAGAVVDTEARDAANKATSLHVTCNNVLVLGGTKELEIDLGDTTVDCGPHFDPSCFWMFFTTGMCGDISAMHLSSGSRVWRSRTQLRPSAQPNSICNSISSYVMPSGAPRLMVASNDNCALCANFFHLSP